MPRRDGVRYPNSRAQLLGAAWIAPAESRRYRADQGKERYSRQTLQLGNALPVNSLSLVASGA